MGVASWLAVGGAELGSVCVEEMSEPCYYHE